MKDRQIQQGPPQMRIPLISPTLHCISMTVIVFMRSGFGFVFLRPRSIFFAVSWAFTLFVIYARYESGVWTKYWLLCIYGVAAMALYWSHLSIVFFRELYGSGEHDNDSGIPHTVRLLRLLGKSPSSLFQKNWNIWGEPGLILGLGLALHFILREQVLSIWLMFVAPCFAAKEMLNFWFQVRQKKRHGDSQIDAEELFNDLPNRQPPEAPKAVGKEKVRQQRVDLNAAFEKVKLRRYAQILRLLPPYTLTAAEENFRTLIKQCHPDSNPGLPTNGSQASELNEAIQYFREKAGCQ